MVHRVPRIHFFVLPPNVWELGFPEASLGVFPMDGDSR